MTIYLYLTYLTKCAKRPSTLSSRNTADFFRILSPRRKGGKPLALMQMPHKHAPTFEVLN